MTNLALAVSLLSLCASAAGAARILPLDRTEVLAGSRFDLKVEFDSVIAPGDFSLTVNGKPYGDVLKGEVSFVPREPGHEASALWVRGTSVGKAGSYRLEVAGKGGAASVSWTAYETGRAKARNVILLIADGLSPAHRTAARVLSKGIREGTYEGGLAMDDMPAMALVGTAATDSLLPDSAHTASSYNTGHKAAVNALGVHADRTEDPFDDPRVELLAELARRKRGMAIGVVSDSELQDATPAAVYAHGRRRWEKRAIAEQLAQARPEVMLGGGGAYMKPKSAPGSKRKDEKDLLGELRGQGYAMVADAKSLTAAAADPKTTRLAGFFHDGNMDVALDRRLLKKGTVEGNPDQPGLVEMLDAALAVLSRSQNGFYLMVEAASVDKMSHAMDWERAVFDTIEFDQAVARAKAFAEKDGKTLVLAVADHSHGLSIAGVIDDAKPGESMREKVGTYDAAGFPNYLDEDKDGYPDSVDVSRRLAVFFTAHPDYYETWAPKLGGPFTPTIREDKAHVANPAYKDAPGATHYAGNIPASDPVAVHTAEDVVLTGMGPGSERVRGFMENSAVFRVMAEALGLSR